MFIGKSGSGKTTLSQAIQGHDIIYKKTQAVSYAGSIVDTPGEFVENRRFYSALMASSSQCDIIGLVQDSTVATSIFPPNFASMFTKKVIGIISKIELGGSDIERSIRFLERAGATDIVATSSIDNTGIQDIVSLLS